MTLQAGRFGANGTDQQQRTDTVGATDDLPGRLQCSKRLLLDVGEGAIGLRMAGRVSASVPLKDALHSGEVAEEGRHAFSAKPVCETRPAHSAMSRALTAPSRNLSR